MLKNTAGGLVLLVIAPGKAGLGVVTQVNSSTPEELGYMHGQGLVDGVVTGGLLEAGVASARMVRIYKIQFDPATLSMNGPGGLKIVRRAGMETT
jgi:hypothetical protein